MWQENGRFAEFRRGNKTTESRRLEPHTPSGNYPGHPCTDPTFTMYHRVRYHVAGHYSPSEFQQRVRCRSVFYCYGRVVG